MNRKILPVAVPVFLAICIGLGVLVSEYLNDVRFYKPIQFNLTDKSTSTKSLCPFGVTPKGKIVPFSTLDNQIFFHGYAFFRKVGIAGTEKELPNPENILLLIGKQSHALNVAALKNSGQMIRGEKIGRKHDLVLLLPESLYTKDSKFRIFLSIMHWGFVQKMALLLLGFVLIMLIVIYFNGIMLVSHRILWYIFTIIKKMACPFIFSIKKALEYTGLILRKFRKNGPISTKKLIRKEYLITVIKKFRAYSIILFLEFIFYTACIVLVSHFFNKSLLKMFKVHFTFFYTSVFILITAVVLIPFVLFIMKKLKYSKQLMTNILLLNAAIFLTFFSVEFLLRISGTHLSWSEKNDNKYFTSYRHWESGWYHTGPANILIDLHLPEYHHVRKTNSLGLCDVEHPVEKSTNEFRIIGLGDSYTEGMGAQSDSTWLKFLERSINKYCTVKLRFMNAGLSGSDPFFEYALLRDKLLKFKPDLVIACFNNEISDIIVRGGMERFKPGGKLQYREGPSWEWLYACSYTFRLIIHTIFHYNYDLMSPAVYNKEFSRSLGQLKQSLLLFNTLARENHFKLLIVLHPFPSEVNAKKFDYLSDVYQFANDNSVPCFDMLRYFIDIEHISIRNSRNYYWKYDSHHNAKGYAAFARGVEWKLKQMGIIDTLAKKMIKN